MQEVNLYDLLKHYAKNWLFIVLCTLAGLLAGLIYNTYVQTPLYKSNATLLVLNKEGTTENKTTTINNYIELIKSRRVLEPVVQKQGKGQSYDAVVGAVTATNDKGTEVIKLSITSTNPEQSKNIVDATVDSFKEQVGTIYKTNTIQVIDSANLPTSNYNVKANTQLALATAAGFLFSVIILFFTYDYKLSKSTAKPAKAKANTKLNAKPKSTPKKLASTKKASSPVNKNTKK